MHEPYTGGAARGFYPPPSPTRKRTRKRTCDMCGSNSEGHDGGHIHHSSHHRQDIAKDQHVPLRTFKTGLGFVRCARVEINQLNQPLYILKGIRESLTGYIMKPYILLWVWASLITPGKVWTLAHMVVSLASQGTIEVSWPMVYCHRVNCHQWEEYQPQENKSTPSRWKRNLFNQAGWGWVR